MYIEILYGRASCRGPPPPANEPKEGSGRYQQRRTYKAPLRELGGVEEGGLGGRDGPTGAQEIL